jgi:hypothetical protein
MVTDAVGVEPVSAPKFPGNREKNRDLSPLGAVSGPNVPVDPIISGGYSKIPCCLKQGISEKE